MYFIQNVFHFPQFLFVFAPQDFEQEEVTHLARRLKTKLIARIAAPHKYAVQIPHKYAVHIQKYKTIANTTQIEPKLLNRILRNVHIINTVDWHIVHLRTETVLSKEEGKTRPGGTPVTVVLT